MMRKSLKMALTAGALTLASSPLVAAAAFADTSSQPPVAQAPISSTLKVQLQADRATLKNLWVEHKNLNAQIASVWSAWKAQHESPLSKLSTDQQNQVKQLRSDVKTIRASISTQLQQLKSLRTQLASAKAAGDKTQIKSLRSQMKAIRTQISPQLTQLKGDYQQLLVLIPKAEREAWTALMSAKKQALSADRTAVSSARAQLKADNQARVADRTAKNWSKVDVDLKQEATDLQTLISARQKLLTDFQAFVASQSNSGQ